MATYVVPPFSTNIPLLTTRPTPHPRLFVRVVGIPDETHVIPLDRPFLLGMVPDLPNSNTSPVSRAQLLPKIDTDTRGAAVLHRH